MCDVEKVFAFLHTFNAVEGGELVNPVVNLREAVVEERILSTCAQVFQIAFRDVIVVFGENFDRIRRRMCVSLGLLYTRQAVKI